MQMCITEWRTAMRGAGSGVLVGLTCLCVLVTQVLVSEATQNVSYAWAAGEWSGCVYRERAAPTQCCQCFRQRAVHCVLSTSSGATPARIAPFYCRKLPQAKPVSTEACEHCQQDCVLSTWSAWSECSDTCSPASRFRTRHVLVLPSSGGHECAPLLDIQGCSGLPRCAELGVLHVREKYSWRQGPWTACRQNSTEDGDCGPGFRQREVYCQDKSGRVIADQFCLQYMKGQEKPAWLRMCHVPCACTVTAWSTWSACSRSCVPRVPRWLQHIVNSGALEVGVQARWREVVQHEEDGALGCPHLSEKRACQQVPPCPRYEWQVTDWGPCELTEDVREVCGAGLKTRQVTCVRSDAQGAVVQPSLCSNERFTEQPEDKLRPPEQLACEVPCPVHCELSEWQHWSPCSVSCGPGGQQVRLRAVVQEAVRGGDACGERFSTRECPLQPCTRWKVGLWSTCFLEYPHECGAGSQRRDVHCESARGEVLRDAQCTQDKPSLEKLCKMPCREECEVSAWTQWSACNQTCGQTGGVQTRTRQILENKGSDPCLTAAELADWQACERRDCAVALWGVGAWSTCAPAPNSSAPCARPGSGLQTRRVFCFLQGGEEVAATECAGERPQQQHVCTAACARDCGAGEWSDWSSCDAPCGDTQRHRWRLVLMPALHGGAPCKGDTGDGMIVQSKPCRRSMACEVFMWNTTEWGACRAAEVAGAERCGRGVRRRRKYCVTNNASLTADEACLDKVLAAPPCDKESCYVPCRADCALSAWSEWSACSHTCESRTARRTRTRHLVHPRPEMEAAEQCPGVEALQESSACPRHEAVQQQCLTYAWDAGEWTDCIVPEQQSECGPGIRRRHVFCRALQGDTYTSAKHCTLESAMPETFQACTLPCTADCQVGSWTEWGECSQVCGMGLQWRSREVVMQAVNGGAECPALSQGRTCVLRPCQAFIWHTSKWGECVPDHGEGCGSGVHRRNVTCPAGEALADECEQRATRPAKTDPCYKPCTGDCEMTQWSDWSPCDCSAKRATQTRVRHVIAEPRGAGGRACGDVLDEHTCACIKYDLLMGEWTACMLNTTEGCGEGYRERSIGCVRAVDGVQMPLSYCTSARVHSVEACSTPCPRDCQLSPYSDWSSCSATCGANAIKIRERRIVRRHNRHGGRRCPDPSHLKQITTCEVGACFTYSWVEQPWSACSVDMRVQCGMGTHTRRTLCIRNDGARVPSELCQQHSEREVAVREEAPCGDPCPGDCVLSQWSDWGPCYTHCRLSPPAAQQTRSRTIVAPAEGGRACPAEWVEKRDCEEAVCAHFFWQAREWDYLDRRRVYCRPEHEDMRVVGGCVETDKPARRLECSPACGQYANCLEGTCACQSGFTGDGVTCLPEYGCHSSAHCIASHAQCDTSIKECVCHDGTLPSHDLVCAPSPRRTHSHEGLNVLALVMLVCCLVLLLLLAALVAACLTCRVLAKRRRKAAHHGTTLSKIDNLDTMRNNEHQARARHAQEPADASTPSAKPLSDHADAPEFKRAQFHIDPAPKPIAMPSYYAKAQNDLRSLPHPLDASTDYGMNEAPLNQEENKVLMTPTYSSVSSPTDGRIRESPLPYITIPSKSTPTSFEAQLNSFKPQRLGEQYVGSRFNSPIRGPTAAPVMQPASSSRNASPIVTPILGSSTSDTGPDHALRRQHSPRNMRYIPENSHSDIHVPASPNLKPMQLFADTAHRDRRAKSPPRKCDIPSASANRADYPRAQPDVPDVAAPLNKYSSLPRHGTSALQRRAPVLPDKHSPASTDQAHNYASKYGSLPTKGRLQANNKSEAAQTLIDYCDALLADLEQAAST